MSVKEDTMQTFTLTCLRCGGQATAYAYPLPTGTIYCPNCSPWWLREYLEFAKQEVKA